MEIKLIRILSWKSIGAGFLGTLFLFCSCLAGEALELKDSKEKESYSLGHQVGESIKKQKMEVNLEVLDRGIRDALAGTEALMSPEEMRETLASIQRKVIVAQQQAYTELASRNLSEGTAFLTENSKKDGVTVLPSGLQYRVLKTGNGKNPAQNDTVSVHYRGTLLDGSEFDNSYSRNRPETFQLDGVIPAWTEALQIMNEGSQWQLFVPPELAYGDRGMGAKIGPNSTLIFELELVSIAGNVDTATR